VAICGETGGRPIKEGPRTITPTAVWAGDHAEFHKLNAGVGACYPAWSPDGKQLAVTAIEGLWVFPAESSVGSLRAESKVPLGEPLEYTYRAFSHPEWSPDGALIAVLVTNGATTWVEVFEAATGRLFYTSPPESYSFSWGATARDLKAGTLDVHLPPHP